MKSAVDRAMREAMDRRMEETRLADLKRVCGCAWCGQKRWTKLGVCFDCLKLGAFKGPGPDGAVAPQTNEDCQEATREAIQSA